MAIEDGIFAVAAVLDVLFGIAFAFVCLRMKRERESHMRQLSILYNNYMTVLDKLKNVNVSQEGHVINPAFEMLDGAALKADDLEAGLDEGSSDDLEAGLDEGSGNDLTRQTTVELLQNKRVSLSPWNNIGGPGRQTRASTARSLKSKRRSTVNIAKQPDSKTEDSDDEDDVPPGLSIA